MIIVNQNKKAITNFNNIETIMISEHSLSDITDKKDYKIISFDNTYRSSDDYSDVLGTYTTEERAKEVLHEIIEIHKVAIPTAVYEMPEE